MTSRGKKDSLSVIRLQKAVERGRHGASVLVNADVVGSGVFFFLFFCDGDVVFILVSVGIVLVLSGFKYRFSSSENENERTYHQTDQSLIDLLNRSLKVNRICHYNINRGS